MKEDSCGPVPMTRFVMAFLGVEILAGIALVIYTLATGKEPPNLSTPILILSVGLAVYWFTRIFKRKMRKAEIWRFSIGNTLAELVYSVVWVFVALLLLGAPFSWEGVSSIFGGDGSAEAGKAGLLVGLLIGLPQVFIVSALFAWLITRKLPVETPIEEG